MFLKTSDQIERLSRYSRGHLWFVLVLLGGLAVGYALDTFMPGLHVPPGVTEALSIGIGAAFNFSSQRNAQGVDFSTGSPAMQALKNDELRQQARSKAFRNGFFVLLAYPPACAFTLTGLGVANPLPFLVASGAWLGAVVFLASLLWYDR